MPKSLAEKIGEAGATVQGERREVTVLFVDIIEFTQLSKRVDSEEIYLIVDEAMRLLVQCIYRYEGIVDKFTGDGLMALFGAPVAHENDPERAVRAALDMQQTLKPLQARIRKLHGVDFHMRIGINTGVVIAGNLGNTLHMEYTVIGNTVNLASRLEGAAEPGTILVSSETYQRTYPIFDYQPHPPLALKGYAEPVPAYSPLGLRADPGRVRGLPGMQIPMIGRTAELDALRAAWQQVPASSRSQFVLVTGEAGLGKSRLVAEFRHGLKVTPTKIYEGHCLAYARSIPFWIFASLLRNMLHMSELDTSQHQRQRLTAFIRDLGISTQHVLPYLLNILGLEQSNEKIGEQIRRQDPNMLQRQTYVALRQVLLALSQVEPIILVLEDLHWIDPASKELLIYLSQSVSEARMLIILVSRDFERKTTIRPLINAVEKNVQCFTDIQLSRLSEREALLLLDQLLNPAQDDSDMHLLQEQIMLRAEGNPFYMEEIVRTLIDQGVLVNQQGHSVLTVKPSESLDQLPGTIKSLILTRFDRLNEKLRAILQKAAVIGRAFPLSLIQALEAADVELTAVYLDELRGRHFLTAEPFNGEPGFTFHHALIQEAIYSTLLKRDRCRLHGQVAHAIEEGNFHVEDDRVEALSYHYVNSDRPYKAVPYLLAAAENASRRSAHESAIEHYRQALALMEDQPGAALDDYIHIWIGLGRTLKLMGEFSEAGELLDKAVQELSGALPQSAQRLNNLVDALRELADVRQREGSLDEAVEHLELALVKWNELGMQQDPRLWYALLDRMAWVKFRLGLLDEAVRLATMTAHALEEEASTAPALLASLYNTLGGTYYQQGNHEDAILHVQNSLRLHEMLGYAWGKAVAHINLGILYYVQGKWPEAVAHYRQADAIELENGFVAERAINLRNLGLLHVAMGEHEQALRDYETSLVISKHVGDSTGVGCCHIGLAHLAQLQSRWEDAAQHIRAAEKVADALAEDHFMQLMMLQSQLHAQQDALQQGFELANQALKMALSSSLSEEEMDAYRILGVLHIQAGEYAKAEAALQQSADLGDQRHNPYRHGLALLALGHLYHTQLQEKCAEPLALLNKACWVISQAIERFESLGAKHDLKIAQDFRLALAKESEQ